MWDSDTARRYDAWFQSRAGRFALTREIRLIEHMTAGWPRRGQRLLEIGCGTGVFLEVLHGAGFDVTGLDLAPAMLETARRRLGNRADLHLGDAGHLPFEDKTFDFSVLLTVLEFCPDPGLAVREAARVAKKGLLVGYLNRMSCHGLGMRLFPGHGPLRQAKWFTPASLNRLLRDNLGRRPAWTRSVLPGPMRTWNECAPWRQLNTPILPLPLGAFCARVVSLADEPVKTPLPAFTAKTCPG